MDLAKAFFFVQFSCAGAKENGKEEQVLPALFGNFNLDFPTRFTYSDVKEVGGDSSFVLQNLKPANLLTLAVFKTTASSVDAKRF